MSFGQFVAFASFVLSLGTISLTFFVGVSQGTVEYCNPFTSGCTDITHTGITGDAGFLFRGGLISGCVFFIVWWMTMYTWLSHTLTTRASKINAGLMTFFGVLGAVGLIWGTAVLATTEEQTLWGPHVRGANLFFQGILLALSFNYYLIWRARKHFGLSVPSFRIKTVLFILIWIVLLFFIANSVSRLMDHGTRVAEWWSTYFIGFYFLSSFWDWKRVQLTSENRQL